VRLATCRASSIPDNPAIYLGLPTDMARAIPLLRKRELALRAAIDEGLKSGIIDNFDSEDFLLRMKEQKHALCGHKL